MQRQTPWTSREKWCKIKLLILPQRLMQRARKRRRNKQELIASVSHLTRHFLPFSSLRTQAFPPTPMDSCFPSLFATPSIAGACCPSLAPPPHPRRPAWIQCSELRHRGDLRSLKSGGDATSPCPISVARRSLAAPGKYVGFSCLPRRASVPLAFSSRLAVTYLGPAMGF